jgi:hypothetical protein
MLHKAAILVVGIALITPTVGTSVASAAPVKRPSAPQALVAAPANGSAYLTWRVPKSRGGAPILGYSVFVGASPTGPWKRFGNNIKRTRATVSGLDNGTPYWFRVTARNKKGVGAAAVTTQSVTPLGLPSEPRDVTVTPGDATIAVSWTPPLSDGGLPISDYVLHYATKVDGPWQEFITTSDLTATATGLANGTQYWVQISARNAAGVGASARSARATPRTTPQPPTEVMGVPGDGSIALSWKPPAFDGGAAITGYTVSYATGPNGPWTAFISDPKKTSATASGLKNGTPYWLQVYATNVAGAGSPAFVQGSITPRTAPLAPQDIALNPGNAKITVTWTAPLFDGGAPVTGYTAAYATSLQGPWTAFASDTTSLSAVATGLTNGTPYWVRVVAKNAAGAGTPGVGGPTTPVAPPVAPTLTWSDASSSSVTVTWPAVANATSYQCSAGAGTASVSGTTCTMTGLGADTVVTATISACNAGGCTPATVQAATHPIAPQSAWWEFDGQSMPGSNRSVTVAWSGGTAQIYCVKINSTPTGCTSSGSYSLTTILPDQAYTFTVQVQNRLSGAITGQTNTAVLPAVPASPAGVAATPSAGVDSATPSLVRAPVMITWNPVSGVTHYLLLRNGVWVPSRVEGGSTSFLDNVQEWNSTKTYQVAACTTYGCSLYSPAIAGTTPPAPVSVSASRSSGTSATWSATSLPTNVKSWRIKICNRTAMPDCNPDDSPTWTSPWRAQTGDINNTSLTSKHTYAWVVVGRVNSDGTGNGTTSRIYVLN